MNVSTAGNVTVFVIDNSASAIGTMAVSTLVVFSAVIALALFIALPPGFCSRRARWLRVVSRTIQGAGKVLIEEIRGEEEVPLSSGDEQEDEEEWVKVEETKEEDKGPARPLTTAWTRTVLNHDSSNPNPPTEARRQGEDPILLARTAGHVNANKSGTGDVYF